MSDEPAGGKASAESLTLSDEELATRSTVFRDDLLAGQVVVVSGAGSGIGRATAWLAARLGAKVVLCGRTAEKLDAVCDAMQARGLEAATHLVNIRDREAVDSLFEWLTATYDGLDLLVNSAGGQFPQAAIDFSPRGWGAVIDTNLNGTFHMMQAAARTWRDSGRPGSIVNLVVVPRGLHGVAHTVAARAGVIEFSRCVSVEWAPYHVRVNCVAPGTIVTEGWAVYSEEARASYPKTSPAMRAGSPWEVAEACVYIGGPAAGYITGEVLTIDGGGQHWGEVWTTDRPEWFGG